MMFSFQSDASRQEPQEPRQKRAKISVACNVCKGRKTKCDGARPVCGPCSKRKRRSQPCLYREIDHAFDSPTGHVQHSPVVIRDFEQRRPRSEDPNHHSRHEEDDNASLYSEIIPTGSLFGASSGAHILHEVGNMTDTDSVPNKRQRMNHAVTSPLKRLPKLQSKQSQNQPSEMQFAIPTRKVADHLLNLYWDYVDSAYPWLDRPSIEAAYETLWTRNGQLSMNERALHCILNLMFATSCVASQGQPPLSRYQSSVEFFERAQELMSYELMDIYNFEIIQILLLTAVYLQHDKMPQKCFRNISTAIHVAQELGLHIPENIEMIEDLRERDLARQVWNGCVIMDRIASMTFGCELKVPQSVAKQGLNSLLRNTAATNAEATTLPSKVNFYISFCRLHHIIGDVLETFYIHKVSTRSTDVNRGVVGTKLDSIPFDKIASLSRIESDLKDWTGNLHPFFKMPSDFEDPTPTKHITREANVLRARYLSVRLLLFRPFLLQMNDQKGNAETERSLYSDDQIMQHVVSQCQIQCTKAAADIIEFITRNLPGQTEAYILPSNWYTVSYVYMAVTILLAARTSKQIVEHFSASRLRSLLHQARDILRDYESHTTLVSRCSSVLKLIEDNVDMHDNGTERGAGEVSDDPAREGPIMPRELMERQEVRKSSLDLAWVDNYTFDWNEWPMFFAQLD
ncbi:hypothetical protein N7541_003636 [Penicillium brevicompactum]|uniref:Zn(2)-C6 fungal-type domain-containing protein n=1 Tax=Penicillium brevicompactum TaxID=5074 RepID=A0A9W9RMB5_PENBR|nr:hypothetical protein N7541_003636 [Penicillium brevicompactum]